MTARSEIAAAASTAAGITCQPFYAQDTKPGQAYVRLDRTEYPDKFGGIAYYAVVVMLPQDLGDAERFIETNQPAIVTAVSKAMPVESAQLRATTLPNAGTVLALFINGHREAD